MRTAAVWLVGVLLVAWSSPAYAATRTWTGTNSGSWADSGNWGGTAPGPGDDLVFPSVASNKSNTNDLASSTTYASITFTGSGYTLSGNAIVLGAGGIIQNLPGAGGNAILLAISMTATRTVAFTGAGSAGLLLGGAISGAGGLTVNGNTSADFTLAGNNSYGGGTSLSDVFMVVGHNNAFGTGSVTASNTTINLAGFTVSNGLSTGDGGLFGNSALHSGTWNGPVTLTGNSAIGAGGATLAINGVVAGNFILNGPENVMATVVMLNASSPGMTGTLHPIIGTLVVNGIFNNASVSLASASVGTTLAGSGTVGGAVPLLAGMHLAPGYLGAGALSTGSLSLPVSSLFDVDVNGPTAGSQYDQAVVTGAVSLGGTLNVSLGFAPLVGAQFTIIDNDGADPVSGTFAGLAEGATFAPGLGTTFRISYVGGTGNDVVLTVTAAPVPVLPKPVLVGLVLAVMMIAGFALRRRPA